MSDIYDIPTVARGRIITPGEDAVEFKGRGGASFRLRGAARDHFDPRRPDDQAVPFSIAAA